MLYAKVVFGLAVQGPFDYSVTEQQTEKIKPGSRVLVEFGRQKRIGYVTALSRKSSILRIKPVIKLLDENPALAPEAVSLARKVSEYYSCSLGEALESALTPAARRLKKALPFPSLEPVRDDGFVPERILFHDLDGNRRWDAYAQKIADTLARGRSAVVILTDQLRVDSFCRFIAGKLKGDTRVVRLGKAEGLEEWLQAMEPKAQVIVGMRSAVFSPSPHLGLLVIDDEEEWVYKQEQTPHYHARTVAIMRSHIQETSLILGSVAPSLESFNLCKTGTLKYIQLPRQRKYPDIVFMFSGKKMLSAYLENSISSVLAAGGKALLFINRKGFATLATCNNCAKIIKCQRCSSNLVYHYQTQRLSCHHCNYKIEPPKICPFCNSGYVVYSGLGTEKVESEVARIFPAAKIARIDDHKEVDFSASDIFVATSFITKGSFRQFDLIGILAIDSELNRPELSAAQNTFGIISKLACLTDKKVVIQTNASHHRCFQAVLKNNPELFYEEELKERKQLHLPPFSHVASISMRGAGEDRVEIVSRQFYEDLVSRPADSINLLAIKKGIPYKLRGNYYWHIIVSARSISALNNFLKSRLKMFRPSGIIVTVDVDPV